MSGPEITAKQVKELRDKTGVGMMECKRALAESEGNLEEAVRYLREKGLAIVKERQERSADQGIVETYLHIGKQIGSMVEVNCETDFVARNDEFLELAHDVALQVAALKPVYLDRESVPTDIVEVEKEKYRARCEAEKKPEDVRDRIVEGLMEKYYQEVCLLDQQFVKDPSLSVAELVAAASGKLGEKIKVRRFSRFQVGQEQEGE
jgi:elongation factor Ts